ncbi:MAG: DEAD/DEAH box helicase family protein [Acidobacteria bacterium]|nr:DEAD/DEAH box helicase family protein [Acidobacteriota bacterium]
MTAYHAKYFAHEITKRSASDNIAKLGASLFNATVDLNPHQLDAALFAFRSPLSRGAILADEVGLGKTIEAGIIISQLWAERKRRILVIAPTILRKQWAQELADKFYLPAWVVDAREYKARQRTGAHPFEAQDSVIICSYNFAQAKETELKHTRWDLVVIDEAHRLRNVYKSGNKIASAIKRSINQRPTLLLTATPLQNSLLELYGLVSFLDEHIFGDSKAFRARYMRGAIAQRELDELRQRLKPICQRTLRRQVSEYVRFTNRIPFTQDFTPTAEEQRLYDLVSAYLQRQTLNALPASQRKLMTLVLRKLLASSTFAIAGTLRALAARLKTQSRKNAAPIAETLAEDFEAFDEMTEEWTGEVEAQNPDDALTDLQAEIGKEIKELSDYGDLAASITFNAKGQALLQALEQGFSKLEELGARRKAVIFTESRRTQEYLFKLLNHQGYGGRVMTINGTNTDERSSAIYRQWLKQHEGESTMTGNKTVNLRAALVEHFRDDAEVMIATEAAAEGVNLQFCSLVVNYDLPWNPQRIEQRIGRCHRYGQTHDVVVVNFLNRSNAADKRVFELLSEKFRLFEGVFGSSDEVLGALETGVDFERRIGEIYQSCRTSAEIDLAFAQLRQELEDQIAARMTDTRAALLENFDEEVHRRLRLSYEDSRQHLDQMERCLWRLTKYELTEILKGETHFDEQRYEFDLHGSEIDGLEVPSGRYRFVRRLPQEGEAQVYRLGHPLAEHLIAKAESRTLPPAEIIFDYTNHQGTVGLLKSQQGKSGYLTISRLKVTALEEEDRLLCAVFNDEGQTLHSDFGEKLFSIDGQLSREIALPEAAAESLQTQTEALQKSALQEISERNSRFFEEEIEKLERWADDLKHGLEMELKDLDAQIKQARRDAKLAVELQSKLEFHRRIKELEAARSRQRRELYEAQDDIDSRKEALISGVEAHLQQSVETTALFTIRWKLI